MGIEFLDAVWRFVVTYVTQAWYFDKKALAANEPEREAVPFCLTPLAYLAAFTQNFGTLAAGSAMVAMFRPLRMVMNAVTALANDRNAVGKIFNMLCLPCVTCHRATLQPLHKNAYMDVALNSHSF